jgi:hypothetical protein
MKNIKATSNSSQKQQKKIFDKGENIRGRYFSQKDIKIIKSIVKKYFKEGRVKASVEICNELDWKQPNGWLKDRACRDVLLSLEKKGYLTLPPRKTSGIQERKKSYNNSYAKDLDITPIENINFSTLKLHLVKGTFREPFWNWLVKEYHYLSFNIFVGRSLKYLITSDHRVIGAIGWCDPAWNVSSRDLLLNSFGVDKIQIRYNGINNGRYLILPWVRVPNLASHVLSLAIKHVVNDWSTYYSITPFYLETFVDPSKYMGTCYKASNWIYLGDTKGYLKKGQSHHNSQEPKMFFIYPIKISLRKSFSKYLEGKRND